jgi:Trypsin-like peptidase domain
VTVKSGVPLGTDATTTMCAIRVNRSEARRRKGNGPVRGGPQIRSVMPPVFLPGESPADRFVMRTEAGMLCDPSLAIVPIAKQSKLGEWTILGTGFFIGQGGILVTAKHVLADDFGPDERPKGTVVIFQFLDGQSVLQRNVWKAKHHPTVDISLVTPMRAVQKITGISAPNQMLRLTGTSPPIGAPIFSLAYPESTIRADGSMSELNFRQAYFKGELIEYLPDGRDRVMLPGPCFRTSMVIHGGASGGPVFDSQGRVFAVNSTGWGSDPDSYVSPIAPLLEFTMKMKLPGETEPREVTLRELGAIGYMGVDP